MSTCKDCKHWAFDALSGIHNYGSCSHPTNGNDDEPEDGFGRWMVDFIGSRPDSMISAETGPDFGCIHWEPQA